MRFNRSEARSRRRKGESEHVFAEVPAIIEPHTFEQVQSLLKSRNPRVTPPRVVSGPILLTGLAVCATCDGAMTLRTGTSKTGTIHRYCTCSSCARQGKTACKGRSIGLAWSDRRRLDDIVVWHSFGHTHVCKPEDFPVMPVEYAGFTLKPSGFFGENPAIDLPHERDAASRDHCSHD